MPKPKPPQNTLRVQGSGFRVSGLGFRVSGLGFEGFPYMGSGARRALGAFSALCFLAGW